MKIKKGNYCRVCIKWLDSTSRNTIWWDVKNLEADIEESEAGDYFYSVGYLFKETKLHYYLANSIHFENDKAINFGQVFQIPRGCVLKIERLAK